MDIFVKLLLIGGLGYGAWRLFGGAGGAAVPVQAAGGGDLAVSLRRRAIAAGYGAEASPPLLNCDQWGFFFGAEQGRPAPAPESFSCFPEGNRTHEISADAYVARLLGAKVEAVSA